MNNFDPDQPISSKTEDKLFRGGFVNEIAEELSKWRHHDSLTVGICGEWGQGKTSILNLLRNEIEERNRIALRERKFFLSTPLVDFGLKVPIVREWMSRRWINVVVFSTWNWGSGDIVVNTLLKELGSKTGVRTLPRFVSRFYRRFVLLGELISQTKRADSKLGKSLAFLLAIATTGLTVGLLPSYASDLASGFYWLLLILAWCSSGILTLNRGMALWSVLTNKSIEEIQNDLRTSFKKAPRPIVVFIDDIDRLNNNEIRAVLQLVKTNCAFPNLVYVLAYDRDRVSKAHDLSTSKRGLEYVRKIVNIELEMPAISDEFIRSFVIEEMNRVFYQSPIVLRGGDERWSVVLNSEIMTFFKSIRDVRRFVSSLSFYANLHNNKGALEVNPIDLFIIEIVRMHDSVLFNRIKSCRHQLTKLQESFFVGDGRSKYSTDLLEELVRSKTDSLKKLRSHIMCELFPQLKSKPMESETRTWRQEFRVCDLSFFNRYFQVRLSDDTASARELSDFLNESIEIAEKRKLVSSLIASGGIAEFVKTLRSITDEMPFEVIENNCVALYDCADEMGEARNTLFRTTLSLECVLLTYSLLRPFKGEVSDSTLMSILNKTQGLVAPLRVFALECESERLRKPDTDYLLFNTSVQLLKDRCLALVKQWVDSDELIGHQELAFVLYRWNELANNEEVGKWILDKAKNIANAKSLLNALTTIAYGSAGNFRILHGEQVDSIVSLNSLYELVENIPIDQLSEDLVNCRELLREAVDRKTSGQPYEHVEKRYPPDQVHIAC